MQWLLGLCICSSGQRVKTSVVILLDRNLTVVYWMGAQMFVERGIQILSSQRYMNCSNDQFSFLRSKFTTLISSVKMDLGHYIFFLLTAIMSSFVHRDCSRDGAAGKGLCSRSSWEVQPASVAQTADSCSAHSFSSTQLLQGTRPVGFPSPAADTVFQADITLQGWSAPSSASRGLQCPLCHSLSHGCAISTKVWTPATEHSAGPSSGGPGGGCSLRVLALYSLGWSLFPNTPFSF